MTIYPQQNHQSNDNSDYAKYDLESQKRDIAEATEEIKKELIEKWKKQYANAQILPARFDGVNPELTAFILSFKHTLFYNDLAKKFNLNSEQRNKLPQIIWHITLEKKWDAINELLRRVITADYNTVNSLADLIKNNILLKAQELSEKSFSIKKTLLEETQKNNLIKTTLSDALKKFPEVGEQLITENKIKLKNFPEPARPSVKNWLSDYTFNLGYDPHDSITRSSYVFQNENAKILNTTDRQKLGTVLKAYDENSEISVNVNTKQIVFEQGRDNRQPTTNNLQPTTENRQQKPVENSFAKNTLDSPKDIFESREENKNKFFDGHIVQGRQWTNLPEKPQNNRQRTTDNEQPEKTQGGERKAWSVEQYIPNIKPEARKAGSSDMLQPHVAEKIDFEEKHSSPNVIKPVPLKTEFPRYKDKNMQFSSPQKMPFENNRQPTTNNLQPAKQGQNRQPATDYQRQDTNNLRPTTNGQKQAPEPQPMRITPSGFNRNTYNHSDNNPQSKNVVNLKETND